ncbi:MAG: LacI family DNA-binding transcriptional regulator [Chloroflexi bacterium]|uniref:LacI family DNA-binding transcriptional regulator n=1 Tax=Candidatus Flexifilum breve TaxID=3140694 RepID=UPI0031363AEF|nr:LacI family DNA-binding transcriptional regulator [Chloroflexota bacterium]
MSKKKARLKDVAQLAGVSTTTASVVLNGRIGDNTRVGPETQERVWNAVKALGYVPNPLARSLQRGRNNILAVFTYELLFPAEHSNFYYPIFLGIEEEAARLGDNDLLLITSAGDTKGRRKIFRNGTNRLMVADGAILLGLNEDKEDVNQLIEDGYPFVYIGRRQFSAGDSSYVAPDYISGMGNLVQYLKQQGHTHIGYVHGVQRNEPAEDRLTGYLQAQAEFSAPAPVPTFHFSTRDALTDVDLEQMLETGVTALIAEAELGKQIYVISQKLNLHIPEDFSLVIAGEPLDIKDAIPGCTSLRIPLRELGELAVRVLLQLLEDPTLEPIHELVDCGVIPGSTVRNLTESD